MDKMIVGVVIVIVLLALVIPVLFDALDPITYVDPAGYVLQTGITRDQSHSAVDLSVVNVNNATAEVTQEANKMDGFLSIVVIGMVLAVLGIGASTLFKGS